MHISFHFLGWDDGLRARHSHMVVDSAILGIVETFFLYAHYNLRCSNYVISTTSVLFSFLFFAHASLLHHATHPVVAGAPRGRG